ncbi:MAG: sigma-70 family RNA polymerase sigma factor [Acidobacteriota bacterium]
MIDRVGRRDKTAFGELYDRYSQLVLNVAWRILKERQEAEDTLQEVFLKVWNDAASYDPNRGTVASWLVTISRSRAIDKLRSRRSRTQPERTLHEGYNSNRDQTVVAKQEESIQNRLLVSAAIMALTSEQRVVIDLAYYEGMSQSEIAEALKEPLGTVKTRIRNGLMKLKEILVPQPGE